MLVLQPGQSRTDHGDGAAQDGAVVNNPEEIVVNNAEGGNVGGK